MWRASRECVRVNDAAVDPSHCCCVAPSRAIPRSWCMFIQYFYSHHFHNPGSTVFFPNHFSLLIYFMFLLLVLSFSIPYYHLYLLAFGYHLLQVLAGKYGRLGGR